MREHGIENVRLAGGVLAVVAAAVLAAGCRGERAQTPPPLRTLSVPAAPGSSAPFLAHGADDNLYLTWIEERADSTHALRLSRYLHGIWSPPATVAEGADWFVNWADVPGMTALSDGTLAAHWLVRMGGEPYAYGIMYAVARDSTSWSEPALLHGDGTLSEHGFASWFPLEAGFGVVWLDGREMGGGHGHGDGGDMALRFATVDRSGAVTGETVIDPRVCECCGTDAVALPGGGAVVAYRDRNPDEIRDISVVRWSEGEWSGPALVHDDGWKIAGCPVNGPALAFRNGVLALAWFTGAQDRFEVRVAFSRDQGRTFAAPVRVDGGNPLGRVDLIWRDDDTVLVSWLETVEGDAAEIRVRSVTIQGRLGDPMGRIPSRAARASGFPRLAEAPDGTVLVVWTDAAQESQLQAAVLNP